MSHARGRGALLGPTFFCILLLLAEHALATEIQIVVRGDLVAIDAADTSVRDILGALVTQNLLDVESALALDNLVTLHTDPEPLAILLRRLLRQHSYDLVDTKMPGSPPQLLVHSTTGQTGSPKWQAQSASQSLAIDQALIDLSSPDPEIREEAVLTLSDTGDQDVAVHFISSLEDPDIGVREAARAAIEDMETTDFIEFDRLNKQAIDE